MITFSAAAGALAGCGTEDHVAPNDAGAAQEKTSDAGDGGGGGGKDGSVPRTPDTSCPTSAPRIGDPCVGALDCTYGGSFCTGGHEISCQNGTWFEWNSSCNPPYYQPDAGDDGGDAG